MSRKAVADRKKRIIDHIAKMLVQHLQQHVFRGAKAEDMARRMGVGSSILSVPWWQDVPDICEAASLDIGLTIRDQKGNEVTLWPAENFSTGFKPRKPAGKKADRPDPSHYTTVKHIPASNRGHSRR